MTWRYGWLWVVVVVVSAAAYAGEAGKDGPLLSGDGGKVILDWKLFRELTKGERMGAEEPKIALPWKEVEDLLGVKVENVTGAELTLNWRQFKALLQWSVEKKRKAEVVPLPAEFVVAACDYAGMLREQGATFELTVQVDVLREEGWKRVPLLPATVALESAVLPPETYLNVHAGHYELLTRGKGRMEVKLKFAVAVAEQAGAYQVRFGTVPSSTTTLKLTVPREKVDVKVAGAQAVLPLEAKKGETVVGAALASGAPVHITWERALEAVEKVPPKIYAETRTLVAVGEGILTCRERIDLSILHTGIRSVNLSVPERVSVLEVTGAAVRDWHAAEGKLEVRFAHEVIGSQSLSLTFERIEADQTRPVVVPVIGVTEAIRERGYLGVVALANVEISAPEHPGATSVDARELPADILQMTNQPVLLAFRYVGKDYRIPLAVRKHEDVKVLVTIVDSGILTVMQTMDGRRITKAIYNVRNNRNQFLRLALPAGAEVWSAMVAGRSVRPASDQENRVLIPLVRSGGANVELTSFPVELVYVEKQEQVGGKGEMKVELPRLSEPITHLMVQLYLPAEGSYRKGLLQGVGFEGPLRWVEQFSHIASAPPPAAQLAADAQAKQLQEEVTRRMEAAAVAAGVTPIRVDLPIRGRLFRFEKILVFDEALWIGFHYSGWEGR